MCLVSMASMPASLLVHLSCPPLLPVTHQAPCCWPLSRVICCHHHRLHHHQATSKNYKAYAERLASHGFAVVQYDFMMLGPWIDQLCHSDAAEVRGRLKRKGGPTCMWLCGLARGSWCG